MKKTLLIISLLTIILISGAAKNNQTDSIAYAKQTVQLKELNTKVDSLIKVTDKLSQEKNYFSAALSSQTAIFTVIIMISLAFAGVFSLNTIKNILKKHQAKTKSIIDGQNKKIKSIEEINTSHDRAINNVLATAYSTVAMNFEKTDQFTCFKFSTSAALYHMKNKIYIACPGLLEVSLEIIESSNYYPKIHNNIIRNYPSIDKDFLELINCEDEAVKKIALKIYSKYLEFKEKSDKDKR